MKNLIAFFICFIFTFSLNAKAETMLYEGDIFIGKMTFDMQNFHKNPSQEFKLEVPSEIPGFMTMKGKVELEKPRWFFNRSESVIFNIKEVNFEGSEFVPLKARIIAIDGVKFEDIYKKTETYKQAVKRNFDNAKTMASDFDFDPMAPIQSVKAIDSVFQPVSWVMAAPAAVLSPVSAIIAKGDKIGIPKDTKFAIEILEDVIVKDKPSENQVL